MGGALLGIESSAEVSATVSQTYLNNTNFFVFLSQALQALLRGFSVPHQEDDTGDFNTTNCACLLHRQTVAVRIREIEPHLKEFLDEVIIPALIREAMADVQSDNLIERTGPGMQDGRRIVEFPTETSR
jgi:hypothetical protein